MPKRTHKFKTETEKLLQLVIHSLYSHKEIFLRELVSNASDAIDRLRFLTMTDRAFEKEGTDYRIRLTADKTAKRLVISDNGIGMDEDELSENLGTIARSGTGRFLASLEEGAANIPELIGQFGVGFYSSFMVAKAVTVETRKAGSETAFRWHSEGSGQFTIESIEKAGRGTDIILDISENGEEFLEEYRLRSLIKQYSDFIEYPIVMEVERPGEKEGEKKRVDETLNSQKAIWMKSPGEVKDEEYKEFYQHLTHDFQDPYARIHYRGEGKTEFNALLYFPSHMPFDLLFATEKPKGVQLYVKRVFIMDDAEALLPRYLRFVRGVVDSADLPLNVSREMLQKERNLERIRGTLQKKVLDTLREKLDKDREGYLKFFKELGSILKEGLALDYENREKLLDLVLFESTATKEGEYTTLSEYVNRMAASQHEIYYLTGENRSELEHSPYMEAVRKRGLEVLFLTEPVDELVAQHLHEFREKKFRSLAHGLPEADDDEAKKRREELAKRAESFQALFGKITTLLPETIKECRLSDRLVDSPAVLVADEHGMGANMERIMRAMRQDVPKTKRILELNPDHELVVVLNELSASGKENGNLENLIRMLYDQALLCEGSRLAEPGRFTGMLTGMLTEEARKLKAQALPE